MTVPVRKEQQVNIKSMQYVIIICICLFGLLGFLTFYNQPSIQMTIGLLLAAAYILWGIIYHLIEGDLHLKNIVEYVGISLLAIILLYSILFS